MNIVLGNSKTRGTRVEVNPLVYVNFPEDNAFLLNLSERGMAIQAMEILSSGRSCQFSFQLPEGEQFEIGGQAKIVWTDRSGRAGLEFTQLSPFDRVKLQQWIMRNMDKGSHLAPSESNFENQA